MTDEEYPVPISTILSASECLIMQISRIESVARYSIDSTIDHVLFFNFSKVRDRRIIVARKL